MEYTILQALASIVSGLNLKDWNNTLVPSVIRKLPEVNQDIDTLPSLYLVPKDEPPKRVAISFGPVYRVQYPCELVFIAAGNRDFVSHLDTYTSWLTTIANAFKTPAALVQIVPAVWDVNVKPGLVIDRNQVNDNYDYGGLTVEVITLE